MQCSFTLKCISRVLREELSFLDSALPAALWNPHPWSLGHPVSNTFHSLLHFLMSLSIHPSASSLFRPLQYDGWPSTFSLLWDMLYSISSALNNTLVLSSEMLREGTYCWNHWPLSANVWFPSHCKQTINPFQIPSFCGPASTVLLHSPFSCLPSLASSLILYCHWHSFPKSTTPFGSSSLTVYICLKYCVATRFLHSAKVYEPLLSVIAKPMPTK